MTQRVHNHLQLLFPVGMQVATLKEIIGQNGRIAHPRGAVGVVVKSPADLDHAYRVRFPDGVEASLNSSELTTLAKFLDGGIVDLRLAGQQSELFNRVIFQCVIGSQAYGLADAASDIDRRGIYLPPAELHWSLSGVPEQLECQEAQETYWEIEKFLVLALKANPNVLEYRAGRSATSTLSRVFCGRRGSGRCDHRRQTISRESSRSTRPCHSDSHVDEAATTFGDAHAATPRVLATAAIVSERFLHSNPTHAGYPSSDSRRSTRTRSLSTRPHAEWRAGRLAGPAALASATTTRQTGKTHPAGGHP